MVDIKYIREHRDEYVALVAKRKSGINVEELLNLDDARRGLVGQIEAMRADINGVSAGGRPSESEILRIREVKEALRLEEEKLSEVEQKIEQIVVGLPNLLASDTPEGESEDDNIEVFSWGEKPKFDFQPLDHIELGKKLDILDLERGAKVSVIS